MPEGVGVFMGLRVRDDEEYNQNRRGLIVPYGTGNRTVVRKLLTISVRVDQCSGTLKMRIYPVLRVAIR